MNFRVRVGSVVSSCCACLSFGCSGFSPILRREVSNFGDAVPSNKDDSSSTIFDRDEEGVVDVNDVDVGVRLWRCDLDTLAKEFAERHFASSASTISSRKLRSEVTNESSLARLSRRAPAVPKPRSRVTLRLQSLIEALAPIQSPSLSHSI